MRKVTVFTYSIFFIQYMSIFFKLTHHVGVLQGCYEFLVEK